MAVETFELTFTSRRKKWQFPKESFVTYEDSDESWCRYFGIGREVTVTEETRIPQAYVKKVNPDGSMEFGAISTPATFEVTCE